MNIFLKAALFLFGTIQLTYNMSDSFFLKELKKKSHLTESINSTNGYAQGQPLLHEAISRYDMAALTYLLEQPGVRTDIADGRGMLPIHLAVMQRDVGAVNCLLEHRADPNKPNSADGRCPIHTAIITREKPLFESLLAHNADLEVQDADGLRPLHLAIKTCRDKGVIKSLIEHGADINGEDADCNKPLQIAINKKLYAIAEYLLANGGDIRARDAAKNTLLHVVLKEELLNDDLAKKLIDLSRGKQVLSAKDSYGNTPLQIAINKKLYAIVDYLLDNLCDIGVQDAAGDTVLHAVLKAEHADLFVAKKLIKYDHEHDDLIVNARDGEEHTPLQIAMSRKLYAIADYLLANGGDITVKDEEGNRLLHVMLKAEQVDVTATKKLIKYDHEHGDLIVNARDGEEHTPLQIAMSRKLYAIADYLSDNGGDITVKDEEGNTLLHVMLKAEPVNEVFVRKSIDLLHGQQQPAIQQPEGQELLNPINAKDGEEHTPLQIAMSRKLYAMAEYLFDNGCDIMVKGEAGNTLLHLVLNATPINVDFLNKLVNGRARLLINTINNSGNTPLHIAVCNASITPEIINLLIANGADPLAINSQGQYARDVAVPQVKKLVDYWFRIAVRNIPAYLLEKFCAAGKILCNNPALASNLLGVATRTFMDLRSGSNWGTVARNAVARLPQDHEAVKTAAKCAKTFSEASKPQGSCCIL